MRTQKVFLWLWPYIESYQEVQCNVDIIHYSELNLNSTHSSFVEKVGRTAIRDRRPCVMSITTSLALKKTSTIELNNCSAKIFDTSGPNLEPFPSVLNITEIITGKNNQVSGLKPQDNESELAALSVHKLLVITLISDQPPTSSAKIDQPVSMKRYSEVSTNHDAHPWSGNLTEVMKSNRVSVFPGSLTATRQQQLPCMAEITVTHRKRHLGAEMSQWCWPALLALLLLFQALRPTRMQRLRNRLYQLTRTTWALGSGLVSTLWKQGARQSNTIQEWGYELSSVAWQWGYELSSVAWQWGYELSSLTWQWGYELSSVAWQWGYELSSVTWQWGYELSSLTWQWGYELSSVTWQWGYELSSLTWQWGYELSSVTWQWGYELSSVVWQWGYELSSVAWQWGYELSSVAWQWGYELSSVAWQWGYELSSVTWQWGYELSSVTWQWGYGLLRAIWVRGIWLLGMVLECASWVGGCSQSSEIRGE